MQEEEPKPFEVDHAKTGRSMCKKCKMNINVNEIRIARLSKNPFGGGLMKSWNHKECFFELKTKSNTIVLDSIDLLEGWADIQDEERDEIFQLIRKHYKIAVKSEDSDKVTYAGADYRASSKDNLFKEFRRICIDILSESGRKNKTSILNSFLVAGSNRTKFEGNLFLWLKMLMPSYDPRIYNLQSKQLVKLFSRIFGASHDDMLSELSLGDVSETVATFFDKSEKVRPASKSKLTLEEVDGMLEKLSELTKDDLQQQQLEKIAKKCTSNDLKSIIRLITHDLKINAKASTILEAIHPNAYSEFQASKNLAVILKKFSGKIALVSASAPKVPGVAKTMAGLNLMVPVAPMLAEACKDLDKAIQKAKDGFYSEIKYDGERVQIHKKGKEFKFFSRNLKEVVPHKVERLKEFVPKAFPDADDLILDSEILLVDTEKGDILPFGTLGVHKKAQFKSAEVCLFVFDIIYYNGEDLTKKTLRERKKILHEHMKPIKYHVEFSEVKILQTKNELITMIQEVLQKNLEGLVLKNVNGVYSPDKRHWFKVKKDYLLKGQMADAADLVVLGAFFGTGKKGGSLSIFLMCTFDTHKKVWKTVTKAHSGLDDSTIEHLQIELKPLMQKCDGKNLPKWLKCNSAMIPDFIARNPDAMPVWEIAGAEFTKADGHTADGISIRFPRVTRRRSDKQPAQATNLEELKHLCDESKKHINLNLLDKMRTKDECSTSKPRVEDKNTKPESSRSKQPTIMDALKPKDSRLSVKRKNSDEPLIAVKREKIEIVAVETEKLGLFSHIVMFIPEVLSGNTLKSEIGEFKREGGRVTKLSIEATHVLHDSSLIESDLSQLRNNFQSTSRHIQYQWLIDSVFEKRNMNVLPYMVTLRQK